MNKILTVSVALYNLEKLISTNLESFVKSECCEKLEVLVTDDGSTDSSTKIVEKFQKEYPECIKLIKQKNAGPGSTVNSGIKNATGKYFMMVDGDDWVNTENLNKLVEKLENLDVDLVIADYKEYNEKNNKIEKRVRFKGVKDNCILDFSSISNKISLSMHATIYKTELFQRNNLVLDNCFYTDVEYVLLPIPFVKTCYYFNNDIYIYRIGRDGQSVNLKSMQKNIEMHDRVFKNMLSYYEENKMLLNKNIKTFIINRLMEMSWAEIIVFLSYIDMEYAERKIKTFLDYIKTTSPELNNKINQNIKVKLVRKHGMCLIMAKIIKRKYNI